VEGEAHPAQRARIRCEVERPRHRAWSSHRRARILSDFDVQPLIRRKYGWQKRLLELSSRGKPDTSVTIAIDDP
jgi:hypothetical protein